MYDLVFKLDALIDKVFQEFYAPRNETRSFGKKGPD
jgi:hypothetical protein